MSDEALTAPQTKPDSVLAKYVHDNEDKFRRVLGDKIPSEKYLQIAMNAIRSDEKLMRCTPQSIVQSLLHAAEVQLFPGSTLGHAYLVPFLSKADNCYVCTFILGYKGMVALCHRSSKLLKVEAHTVHDKDKFSLTYGTSGEIVHEPDLWGERDTKNCLGAYAVAHLTNGEVLFERMSKEQLEGVRKRACAKKKGTGPWDTDTLEMYRKTVLRRLAKWLPLEPEDQIGIASDEARDLNYAPRDVDVEVISTADKLNALMSDEPTSEEVEFVECPDCEGEGGECEMCQGTGEVPR